MSGKAGLTLPKRIQKHGRENTEKSRLWTYQTACRSGNSLIHWWHQGGAAMTEMMLLSEAQMARISPFFPLSHGVPRVDDRRVIRGIIFVVRNSLRWRDVPPSYGPHKTIYNRFIRWSELGAFGRIFVELAKGGGDTYEMMIAATNLNAPRTAASLLKKGFFPGISDAPRAG
jgi:putative transposase